LEEGELEKNLIFKERRRFFVAIVNFFPLALKGARKQQNLFPICDSRKWRLLKPEVEEKTVLT